jgi:hypothetical protein
MQAIRRMWMCTVAIGCLVAHASDARAQQIYRWTDANGTVNFGSAPPPDAKGLQADDRVKTQAELDCEAAAVRQCRRELDTFESVFENFPSTLIRNCIANYSRNCVNLSKPARSQAPTARVLVTSRLQFDPASSDRLVCQMTCESGCKGAVEISDEEMLGSGQNSGQKDYAVRVVPKRAGSAYCRVTTKDDNVGVVFNVVRGESVVASARANDGR